MKWVPVGMAVASKDSVDFGYIGEKTVCVAGIMNQGKFEARSFPFKTTRNERDSIEFFTPRDIRPINIYSKYNLPVGDYTWMMV